MSVVCQTDAQNSNNARTRPRRRGVKTARGEGGESVLLWEKKMLWGWRGREEEKECREGGGGGASRTRACGPPPREGGGLSARWELESKLNREEAFWWW